MKLKNRLAGAFLALVTLIQLLPGTVFAADAAANPHWGTAADESEAPSDLLFRPAEDINVYVFYIYKNDIYVDYRIDEYDGYEPEEYIPRDFANVIIENGSGNYTVKIGSLTGALDDYDDYEDVNDIPVAAMSEMSDVFSYTAPSNKYAAPTNLSIENNRLTYDYDTSSHNVYTINYYIEFPDGERKKYISTSGADKFDDDFTKHEQYYNRDLQYYYEKDPEKYNKDTAKHLIGVSVRPRNILTFLPSDEVYIYADAPVPEDKPVDRTVIAPQYRNAAKVCYDLNLMPKLYENYSQNVIGSEYSSIYKSLTGNIANVNSQKELTFQDVVVTLVEAVGYGAVAHRYGWSYETSCLAYAYSLGIPKGVSAAADTVLTYEQLSQLIYNTLEIGMLKPSRYVYDPISGAIQPEYEETNDTLLYKLGYSRYCVNAEISDDTAYVSGKMGNSDNLEEKAVTDEKLSVSDTEIKDYTDKGMKLYVKNGKIISGLPFYRAKVTINNGDKETSDRNVTLLLEVYGYTKYKVEDGEYIDINGINPYIEVPYRLDPNGGKKTVQVAFANDAALDDNADEESKKSTTGTGSIILTNKHNVIYKANGEVFTTVAVECGSQIPELEKNPAVSGYRFDGWNELPEVMPDNDITVEALLTPINVTDLKASRDAESGNTAVSVKTENLPYKADIIFAMYDADGRFLALCKSAADENGEARGTFGSQPSAVKAAAFMFDQGTIIPLTDKFETVVQ